MPRSYIPELDGFRALAVMLVVAYHMTAPFIVGGFIGVWIFFVLSGYLITSLLIADLDRRRSVGLRRFFCAALSGCTPRSSSGLGSRSQSRRSRITAPAKRSPQPLSPSRTC
jgi:acyltransferase-like protein